MSSASLPQRRPETRSCPVSQIRLHSRRPWRRPALSSDPRVPPVHVGSCVRAGHPPVAPLGANELAGQDTTSGPRPAAIHHDRLSGDRGGGVGGEVGDRVGDLLGLEDAAEGRQVGERVLALLGRPSRRLDDPLDRAPRHVGAHERRADGVDPDARSREFRSRPPGSARPRHAWRRCTHSYMGCRRARSSTRR
jgi:hypothetical protein